MEVYEWAVANTFIKYTTNNEVLLFVGSVFVVRSGLTNALIPDIWSWGGVVSDHCPVLAEFYTDEDLEDTYITMKLDNMRIGDNQNIS